MLRDHQRTGLSLVGLASVSAGENAPEFDETNVQFHTCHRIAVRSSDHGRP